MSGKAGWKKEWANSELSQLSKGLAGTREGPEHLCAPHPVPAVPSRTQPLAQPSERTLLHQRSGSWCPCVPSFMKEECVLAAEQELQGWVVTDTVKPLKPTLFILSLHPPIQFT